MVAYRQVFHLLWRLKRVEFVLSNAWKQHMWASKNQLNKALPRLSQVLHHANLNRNKMAHFVLNLSNYMMFEVLEDSWCTLQGKLDEATNLDGLIEAHDG